MLEVEVIAAGRPPQAPADGEIAELCRSAATAVGVQDGHVAVEFVDAARIAALNEAHRDKPGPTDVLSFPIDGAGPAGPPGSAPRELGDIVICPEHTLDLREAVVHGMLHLLGMDHETDEGEMLELQAQILAAAGT